jgi:hypothetical protein
MVEKYTNRYGDKFTFTLLEDGNIQWGGNFEYVRTGYPNIYDEAYTAYQRDGGTLTLEEFKEQIHASIYDDKKQYLGQSEIGQKYSKLVYSNMDVMDMVDPSGGPYLSEGMKILDKEIQEFKWNKEGFLIITKK